MTIGGAEVLADRLARQFADRYETVFACLDQIGELGERLRADGFQVECLNRKSGVDIRCAWRLARFLRRNHVDFVLAHQYTPFFYSMTARALGASRPIIFVEHGRALPDYPRPKRMLFNRWMVRKPDRLIAVGHGVRQALIENEGLPLERIEVIHNGVDLDPFRRDEAMRPSVRAELQIGADAFVIAHVARLDYLKDHLTAVRTMAKLAESRADAVLLLVGDGPERSAIEAEIDGHGLRERVKLLGQRSDVARILAGADAMLLTSVSEGIPLTLIEGMAAALPIVTTDVGGVREVVVEGETALLAPAGDPASLSAQLQRLMSDHEFSRRLGENGAIRANQLFAEPVMHEHYAKVFEEILEPSSRRRRPQKQYV